MDILAGTVNAENHADPQPVPHIPGNFPAELLQGLGLLPSKQQNLPGRIAQNDAALGPDVVIHQMLHLFQHDLSLQGAGILLPVFGGGHDAAPGDVDVNAHGKAPLGKGLGIAHGAAQNPILQKTAQHTLVQLPVVQGHPLPDQNLRHFLDDLTVFDDLRIVAGDADDALDLAVHLNGQVDAPADIGHFPLQFRGNVEFLQAVLDDPVGAGVEIADPGRVVAGNDVSGFVHQIDVLLHQLADFFHNLLGAVLGYFHRLSQRPIVMPVRCS